jgi:phage host-nuclease inhibitor protein Gam
MAANDIKAGKAYVTLGLKDELSKALDRSAAKLQALGSTITGIGAKIAAVGAGGVAGFVPLINAASDLQETMSKFDTVFGSQSATMKKWADETAKNVGRSKKTIADFASQAQSSLVNQLGDPKLAAQVSKALTELAIDLGSFNNVADDDAFAALMSAFRGEADPIERFGVNVKESAVAMELLNKGLDKDKATEAQKAMARFSIIMKQTEMAQGDAVRTGDGFANTMKRLKGEVFDASAAIGSALLPAATKIVSVVASVVVRVGEWAEANKGLVIAAGALVGGLLATGAALVTFGLSLKVIGLAMSGLSAVVGVVGSALAALLNPVVLVGVGLGALAAYFVYTSDVGGQAISWLGEKCGELQKTVGDTVGGISDALAAGDIGLAARVLWAGLKLTFRQGTSELQEKWIRFKALFVQTAAAAFYGAQEIWATVKANLLTAFENTTAVLVGIWDAFVGTFTNAWNTAINAVAKGLNWVRGKFDKTFDADAANSMSDEMLAQDEAARQAAELAKAKQREGERQQSIKDIEAERQRVSQELHDRERAINEAADQNARDDVAALSKSKADLEAQLTALRSEAKNKNDSKGEGGKVPPRLDSKRLNLDDALGNRASVDSKVTVKGAGTFSAEAAALFGGGQVADRIAKAAEETAKNTAKIAKAKDSFK